MKKLFIVAIVAIMVAAICAALWPTTQIVNAADNERYEQCVRSCDASFNRKDSPGMVLEKKYWQDCVRNCGKHKANAPEKPDPD
ncbi:MAG: hypothetical protein V1690_01955 [Candidatus Moraniibacteriota bacterium]